MSEFKLVREYLLSRLGLEKTSGELTIAETERRRRPEMSYGFIHMIWIITFADGSSAASLPLNTSDKLKQFIKENIKKIDIADPSLIAPLKELADAEAKRLFNKDSCNYFSALYFACDAETLAPPNPEIITVRITDNRFECPEDINFPDHCLPDGNIYAVIQNNRIVSLAHAHKTGEYQDIVADIGVDTSREYRRKGYARECVSSVARHAISKGGESFYSCSPQNIASVNTALSAGYRPYAKAFGFTVNPG